MAGMPHMFGYAWPWVTCHLCLAMFGCVWLCLAVCADVCLRLATGDDVGAVWHLFKDPDPVKMSNEGPGGSGPRWLGLPQAESRSQALHLVKQATSGAAPLRALEFG